MRLICPNCGAQYDVEDGVVPASGRDVQCSNCGHTWFQRQQNRDRDQSDEIGTEIHEDPGSTSDVHAEVDAPEAEESPENTQETDDNQPDDQDAPKRRELDEGVADILREEAERESVARETESASLETQQELGIENQGSSEAKDRMARLRGIAEDEIGSAAAAASTTRRDLLPDIEEINSTLTAASDRPDDETAEEYQEKRERTGFRRSFTIVILLFAILALVYVFAAPIVEAVPALKPFLNSYVEWVNALRLTVDGIMQRAVEKLTVLLSQLGSEA